MLPDFWYLYTQQSETSFMCFASVKYGMMIIRSTNIYDLMFFLQHKQTQWGYRNSSDSSVCLDGLLKISHKYY